MDLTKEVIEASERLAELKAKVFDKTSKEKKLTKEFLGIKDDLEYYLNFSKYRNRRTYAFTEIAEDLFLRDIEMSIVEFPEGKLYHYHINRSIYFFTINAKTEKAENMYKRYNDDTMIRLLTSVKACLDTYIGILEKSLELQK